MKKYTIRIIIFLLIHTLHLQSMDTQLEMSPNFTEASVISDYYSYSREQLLQQIQNSMYQQYSGRNSPLHISIIMGFEDIFLHCIINNIDPFYPNAQGDTPLHLAVRHFRSKILKTLVQIYGTSRINILNRQEKTALDIAYAKQNSFAMVLLLEYGGITSQFRMNLNTCHDFFLLHDSAQQNYLCAAKSLLNMGVNVNLQNTIKETALHVAIKNNHKIMIRLLLAAHARVDIQDINGETAYKLLQKMRDHAFYKTISYYLPSLALEPIPPAEPPVQHTICTKPNLTQQKPPIDTKKLFALHKAIEDDATEIARALISNPHQNIELFDKNYNTPLHLAALYNNIQLVLLLLENHVLVNIPNKLGQTPLHIAAQNGCYEIVKALINAHASINAKDEDANTPLHYAALNGDVSTMQFLVMSGASIHQKNNQGVSVFDIAQLKNFKDIAQFLRDFQENNG